MDSETFRSRIVNLIGRSRKALRLYSNVGRIHNEGGNEFTEIQTGEWKSVTADLLKELTANIEKSKSARDLADRVFQLRDKFNTQWRTVESEMHPKQKDLVRAAEARDFVKAAVLSSDLVLLKARMQAAQAAHHELEDVIKKTRVSQQPIELTTEDAIEENDAVPMVSAKVIPIRKIL